MSWLDDRTAERQDRMYDLQDWLDAPYAGEPLFDRPISKERTVSYADYTRHRPDEPEPPEVELPPQVVAALTDPHYPKPWQIEYTRSEFARHQAGLCSVVDGVTRFFYTSDDMDYLKAILDAT